MSPRHTHMLAVALAAAVAGGCGDSEPPEQQAARTETQRFLAAMEARDNAAVCRQLTPKLQQAIEWALERKSLGGSCSTRAAVQLQSSAKAPGQAGAEVIDVRVAGATAVALVRAGALENELRLRKVSARWRVEDY